MVKDEPAANGEKSDSDNEPTKQIPAAEPPKGTVTGEFGNEIEVLAYQSLLRVADAIAARVHSHGKNRTVVVTDGALARFLTLRDQFLGAVALLQKLLEGLKAEAKPAVAKKKVVAEALTGVAAAVVGPIAAVTSVLDAAALLLSYFKVDVAVTKSDVTVDTDTLRVAIAGPLLERKVKVLWPGLSAKEDGADGLFEKLMELEALNQELQAMTMNDALKEKLTSLSSMVETLVGRVFEAGKAEPGGLLGRLAAADAVGRALDAGAWLLVADCVKSGGSTLTRTSLFTSDRITLSGMAIIRYELIDPSNERLMDCGVLYSYVSRRGFTKDNRKLASMSNITRPEAEPQAGK